jgi:YspA, cpYpsA-related SLOG family
MLNSLSFVISSRMSLRSISRPAADGHNLRNRRSPSRHGAHARRSPRGAERIAACWADARKVPQVAFKPDWTRDKKAAPFKRNDRLLDALPIGVVAFPGSGISANLADKAKNRGIPVWRFSEATPAEGLPRT